MPRNGRGGARAGTPGKSYGNRTDLPGKVLPVQAPTGQPYGAAGQQKAMQASLPMSTPPVVAAAPAPVGLPAQGGGPSSPTDPASAPDFTLPEGMPQPGELPGLDAPTDRPDEPVTHGAPVGPGGGPEILPPLFAHPVLQGAAVLNAMGTSHSPQVAAILKAVNATLANQAAL